MREFFRLLREKLGDDFSIEESDRGATVFYGPRRIAIVTPTETRIWYSKYGNPVINNWVDTDGIKYATRDPVYREGMVRDQPVIIERTERTERVLGAPSAVFEEIIGKSRSIKEAYSMLWESPHAFGVSADGKIVDHPNYLATIPPREPGSPINRKELSYAILSLDWKKIPGNSVGFVTSFTESIKNANKKGWDLSPRQIEVARDIIAKYAPEEIAERLGCKAMPVEKTFDTFVAETCQKIEPFMAADRQWFAQFKNSVRGRNRLSEGQRNIALKFISNYRDQLDLETLDVIYPHLPNQEDFFQKFNLATIKLMVEALKTGSERGQIILDKKSEQFLNTNGFGDEKTRYETWRTLVEHVYDRMIKLMGKGKLEEFVEYLKNPDLLKSMIDNETMGASTRSDSVDRIVKNISKHKPRTYTKEQKEAGLAIVSILSSNCDGAKQEDYRGFSKAHTRHGKYLATLTSDQISDADMNMICFFSKYYHRQIPRDLANIVNAVVEPERRDERHEPGHRDERREPERRDERREPGHRDERREPERRYFQLLQSILH